MNGFKMLICGCGGAGLSAAQVAAKVYVTSGCSGHGMGGGFLAVYGTEGTLWKGALIRRGQETVELEDSSAQSMVAGHGWGGSVVDFLDVLEAKIPNPIPARAGARTVAVCEAALQSIQTGRPQSPAQFQDESLRIGKASRLMLRP